ncbi:uncharacterized protein LOC132296329 [Cornus florida]|uniref:uncharacterized protein LOC132296329 n=1 Tax=Cornus florida TaxID=4283 RepID=UPI00289ECB08|nr:uncharacterized protein LOC132296329 [Cornus florida]
MDLGKKHGDPTITLKLDLKKAYDSVDWDFIQKVLQGHGFSDKWIKWTNVCINSPKFSVLCNGVPAGSFSASRGIRQGCPLSPLLFAFVTEYFSNLMETAIVEGKIKVSKAVSQKNMKISHTFYADDLMVVKADIPTVKAIDELLQQFKEATGLQVNKEKNSVIFSKSVRGRRRISNILRFQTENFPFKYLGLPLSNNNLRTGDFRMLVDKINGRLTHWNTINLSIAGRIELLRSVLYSYLYHWVFGFKIPWEVKVDLERRFKCFLWSGKSDVKKISQLKWSQVTLPISEGGFDLRKIQDIDVAAKMTLCWDFVQKKNKTWIQWLHARYLQRVSFWNVVPKLTDSPIWKQILGVRQLILQNLSSELEMGYSSGSDIIGWKTGSFSLKAAWNSCRFINPTLNWCDLCWKHCRPRIAVVVGIILHNKNLSLINLQKRDITITAICHNCTRNVDSNDHLFCTCNYAQQVWHEIFSLLHIDNPHCISLMQMVEWFGQQTTTDSKFLPNQKC